MPVSMFISILKNVLNSAAELSTFLSIVEGTSMLMMASLWLIIGSSRQLRAVWIEIEQR